MTPNPAIFGPASLCVTQGISAFTAFLPHFTEVRKADPSANPDVVTDVRMGEIAAVTLTLGVGVIASSLTGSPVPAVVSAITAAVLVTLYEAALAQKGSMA
ncbi:MAG TPA: hypothetical protein VFI97_03630 [Arthrobacter sp.]|nr:hypothetical protein [Arthrobacter sp.]